MDKTASEIQQKYTAILRDNKLYKNTKNNMNRSIFKDYSMIWNVPLALMLIVIAIICLLMYFSKIENRLAIKKMHGFTSFRLIWDENKKMFGFIVLGTFLIHIIGFVLSIQEWNLYAMKLLGNMAWMIFAELMFLFIIVGVLYWYFHSIQVSHLLKHYHKTKSLITINLILKCIILFTGVTYLSSNLFSFLDNTTKMLGYQNYLEEIDGYYRITTPQEIEEDLSGFMISLSQKLDHDGGIAVMAQEYESDMDLPQPDWGVKPLRHLEVNVNYVNSKELKDVNDKLIRLKQNKPYVLTSEAQLKENKERIQERYPDYPIILMKENQTLFTFDEQFNEAGMGYVKEPILIVNEPINYGWIYLKKGQLKLDKILSELHQEGYISTFEFEPVRNQFEQAYTVLCNFVIDQAKILFTTIGALLILILQFVIVYMNMNSKKLAVKKYMGISYLQRYREILYMQSIVYIIVVIGKCFAKAPVSEFVMLLFLFILEVGITFLFIYRKERKTLSISLKE